VVSQYRRVRLLIPLAIISIVSSCGPDPQLVRRSANNPILPPGSTAPILSISSIPNVASSGDNKSSPAPASGASIRIALSDPKAGQVADIKKALDKPGDDKTSSPDLTVFKRTLILTIAKGAYRPADRLVNLKIKITPKNFVFSDITNFVTDTVNVDIAKLDLSQNNSASASISPTFAGSLVGSGQFGVSTSKTLDEQATLSTRPEILNVNVEGRDLVIYREADRGSDLAGNTLINLTVRPYPLLTRTRFDAVVSEVAIISTKDGTDLPPQPAPNDAEKASIKTDLLRHLRPEDFEANVSFKYVKRHVLTGEDTYAEYRQTVDFETGECRLQRAVVIPAAEFDIPLWVIWTREQPHWPIYLSDELGDHPLNFTDYVTAERVAQWMMRQQAPQVGSRRFSVYQPLSPNKPPEKVGLGTLKQYPKLEVGFATGRSPQPQPSSFVCPDTPVISAAD
jgi:hypothetical protein